MNPPLPVPASLAIIPTGRAVWSWFHGYGRVVQGGPFPLVSFLHGGLYRMSATELKSIDEERLRVFVANLAALEVQLHYRVLDPESAFACSRRTLGDLLTWFYCHLVGSPHAANTRELPVLAPSPAVSV